jgi:hypothetical protein
METFRKRSSNWRARAQTKGYAMRSKTFINKVGAEKWAEQIKVILEKASFVNLVLAQRTTLQEGIGSFET